MVFMGSTLGKIPSISKVVMGFFMRGPVSFSESSTFHVTLHSQLQYNFKKSTARTCCEDLNHYLIINASFLGFVGRKSVEIKCHSINLNSHLCFIYKKNIWTQIASAANVRVL